MARRARGGRRRLAATGLVVGLVAATLAPLFPLLVVAFPIEQLVLKVMRLLFGV